ncbi:MAG: hypothetical protein E6900_05390, partial [Gemella haemolysans]|nr:hypothetical protein [Gemella haemolysans]
MELTPTVFSNLVLLSDKKEPYTLSTIISDNLKMEHHSITRIIRKHEVDFEEFGEILTCNEINGFKIHKLNNRNSISINLYRMFNCSFRMII